MLQRLLLQCSRLSLILGTTLILAGCTDLLVDDTTSVNNYYYAPNYHARPQHGRRMQTHRHSSVQYYYQEPEQVYYQPAPRVQVRQHHVYHHAPVVHHVPVHHQPQPAPAAPAYNAHNAQQAQIASDRAMAQRLQNEEYARAHREAEQIASDRALAERLQAEEYARAR